MFEVDENMVMFAFRYALGRKTGIALEVSDYLINNWSKLKYHTQLQIIQEIKTAIARNEAGMDCDIKEWERILKNGT